MNKSGIGEAKRMDHIARSILAAIDERRILALEQSCVRIPSPTFQEGPVADFFAAHMESIGLTVEMLEVVDPYGSGQRTRQPVGRLRGTGDGPSLMLNGHMDHNPVVGIWQRNPFSGDFEDGWVFGRGSQDDKGGIVAAISAAEALIKAKVRLKGDLVICPVAAHKAGGVGTRNLLRRGIATDHCINTENSGNGLANYCVGCMKVRVHTYATPTFFASRKELRDVFLNPHEQTSYVIQALGPSLRKIPPGGWLTYQDHSELPDYPQLMIDSLESSYFEEGRSTVEFHFRTVPGQTLESITTDMERLLDGIANKHPHFKAELEIPPRTGKYAGWDEPPMETSRHAPLVRSLARWHEFVTGKAPVIGAGPRLGAVGDGNLTAAHGIQTVLYGPGSIDIFNQWPTPDERIKLEDVVVSARVYALTAADLCIAT